MKHIWLISEIFFLQEQTTWLIHRATYIRNQQLNPLVDKLFLISKTPFAKQPQHYCLPLRYNVLWVDSMIFC